MQPVKIKVEEDPTSKIKRRCSEDKIGKRRSI